MMKRINKLLSFVMFSAAVVLSPALSFAATMYSEEIRLDELNNDIKSTAPNLGTQTEFVYMGYTSGSDDDDWICFTAGSTGTLTISQYSDSNTEVYHDLSYNPIATPYVTGKMSVTKGTKYYFCINNYKLWQTGEYYYWTFSIGVTPPTPTTKTITFSAGGGSGSMASKTVTTGSSYTLPSCGFTYTGKNFAGWSITSCCTAWNNPYSVGSNVTVNEDLTLTATWKSPTYPDLKPQTQSGWDSALVVNTSSSSRSNASSFKDTDTIYVHFSAICADKATSSTFVNKIYVDNVSKYTLSKGQTNKDVIFNTTSGCSVGQLSEGTHTIKVVLDDGNAVAESNESNNTISKTITVTATQKYYTIKFYKNDGSGTTASRSFPIGKYQALPWVNSGLGWTYYDVTFKGWAYTSTATKPVYENGGSVYNLSSSAGGTANLYAVLTANVSFKPNGGNGSKSTVEVLRGSTYKLPSCPFTRSGYTFKGWKVTSCCSDFYNPMSAGEIITVNEHTTLTAVWTLDAPKTYTVCFNSYGPDLNSRGLPVVRTYRQTMTVGKSQSLAWIGSQMGWTTPKGYQFAGWALTSEAKSALFANGQTVSNLANADEVIDLYAVWKLLPQTYLVRFHDNMPNPQEKTGHIPQTYDQFFTIDRAQRLAWKDSQIGFGWETPSGYVFLGWSKSSTATVADYQNGEKVMNIGSEGEIVDLYAVWGSTTYKVVFHRNYTTSDTTVYNQTFTLGKKQSLAWIGSQIGWATPSGKTFLGWSKSSSATSATYTNGQSVKDIAAAGATLNLYAVWKSTAPVSQTYVVRFNKNDGSGLTRDQTFTVGVAQCMLWVGAQLGWSRAGYTFLGWSADGGAFYTNGQSVKDIASAGKVVNVYALWTTASKVSGTNAKSGAVPSASLQNGMMSDASTWVSGFYRGTFADGSGTFDLLLDACDDDGVVATIAAQTEDGDWAETCEAEVVGETLVLTFEGRGVILSYQDGNLVATE